MNIKPLVLFSVTLGLLACGGSGGSNRPAPNQAPQLGALPPEMLDANSSITKRIDVSDDRTAADDLQVSVTSDNDGLLPTSALTLSGSGGQRELLIEPLIDTIGSASITVAVTDADGLQSAANFGVDVLALPRNAAAFSRDLANSDEFDAPALLNAIEFTDDAEDDAFADLLPPQ